MEKGRKNRKRRKNDPSFHFLFKGKQLKKEGVSLTLNLNESANQTHSDSVIGIFKDWRVLIGKGKTIHILKGKSNLDNFFLPNWTRASDDKTAAKFHFWSQAYSRHLACWSSSSFSSSSLSKRDFAKAKNLMILTARGKLMTQNKLICLYL